MASARRCTTMATNKLIMFVVMLVVLQRVRSDDSPCDFPAIFNLGDSYSDTGAFPALFPAVQPPYGRTFFGMPAGRQSDGRLTIDFMAQSLGLRYLNAYLDSLGSNFTQGANFASAAGTIRRVNGSLWTSGYSPISLDVQIWQFQQFINRSQFVYNNIGGVYREILPKPEHLVSKALYTFDIGANDLAMGYLDNMTTEQVEAYVPDLMERLASAIQTVYDLGGRYFWVHNTGTLGCLPYALAYRPDLATEKDSAGCSVALNAGPRFFNARLKETVARLRVALPEAAFTYVDVYTAMYRLMSEAKKIGFGDPLRVCCGYGGGEYNFDKDIGCGVKVEVNGTVMEGKSCEDPSRSVSWDGVHLTEAAYKFIFDQIVEGALSDPPVPLRRACQTKGQ
ncbi:hypothetical protein CFC21_033488 [Triticum aestivum]|uniref:GDSL esterase/lipase n=2 Tax=Triticum aestivum TaxID=4565 RepID=A0A9R1JK33_WHEAT|nr:GDSL esterase/lipase ACHE-like [Triticum aestivum]KAF7020380.1 hypothetical protein CFC21_033488 [Triticum aestivum]